MSSRPFLFSFVLLALCSVLPAFAQRQMEKLGRGVVALKSSSTQVYVGWRLLGNDPDDIAFNLYRSANGAAAVKINGAPLTATTDYTDTPANLATTAYTYSVRPVLSGIEVPDTWANPLSGPFTLPANAPTRQYWPVPIQPTPDGALKVGFCWVGDLDGDGEYDYVIARHNQNVADSREFLEGYKRDGTFLWRLNMGPNSTNHYNIEPGSSTIGNGHGDNVTVYDLDGDGKAEAIVRTANGVVFGDGATLVAANNSTQFISIVNGETGAEMARATVPNPYLSDGPMNGHMGIIYPDGQRPSVVLAGKNRRADNGFQGLATAWDYRNGVITQRWSYNSATLNQHAPEAHQIRLGDPDNDGKDEFLDIGYGIDDNGLQLFSISEIVHGDRFHMTDIDPDRPGLETYLIQQNNGTGLATAIVDSGTGKFINKWYAAGVVDVGRGLAADIDPAQKGLEVWSTQGGIFNSKGVQIYNDRPFPPEAVWWDGNLSREFLANVGSSAESPAIARFDSNNPGAQSRTYTFYNEDGGCYWGYGGRPPHTSDLFGDWREEIVVVANNHSELRVYTTKNAAANRLYTLMHNPQYRIQATTKGYVQSSYVDYYLGDGMTIPQPPPMVDAKLVWRGGAGATTWDVGATQSWKQGAANSAYANGDTVRFDIAGNAATTVALVGALSPGAVTVYGPGNYTFGGTGSLAGATRLVKAGAGVLTVSGTHDFTGRTTVWDGALHVNGDLAGSPISVWGGTWGGALAAGKTGGRIGGSGRFSQPVTLKYRGAITPGAGMNSAGTLTLGAGLVAENGSTFALDLSNNPAGANDRIAITGNLTLAGTVSVVINPLNTALGAGTYTLATYSGTLTGGLANLAITVPPGTPYTAAVGAGAITLTVPVTRAANAVTWRGAGPAWDIAASQNWLLAGSPNVFVSGDAVTFDATGAASPTITLNTDAPVASMTVNASANYTFSGTGSIVGSGGLVKSGAGTLTLNTTNHYTGPTTVTGGVLAIANLANAGSPSSIGASSAAAGNLTLNGGTLRLIGAQTSTDRSLTLGAGGGALDIANAGSSIQISGTLTGPGALTKSGPGTLLLASTNTYAGGTVLNGGTIYLAGANANVNGLGSGSVTLNNATLTMANVQASETAAWNLIVPAGATGRLNADGRCSLTGTLTGAGTFDFYTPFIRTELRGNWSAFTGRINVKSATDGGDFRVNNTFGYANAAINLENDAFLYYNTGSSSPTLDIGEFSGSTASLLGGGPTGSRTVTWRIGARNTSSTFSGTIVNGTGPVALTKIGTGTLTLGPSSATSLATTTTLGSPTVTLVSTAGLVAHMPVSGTGIPTGTSIAAVVDATTLTLSKAATATGAPSLAYAKVNTFTGPTTVSAGALRVDGVLAASPVTVAPGATLGGLGAFAGPVTFQSGSALLTLGAAGAPTFKGALTFGGPVDVLPAAGVPAPAPGTYRLFTYTGSLTGTPNFTWGGPTLVGTFDTSTPGIVSLTLAAEPVRAPAPVVWTGAASGLWNATAANWKLAAGGAATSFLTDDDVLFDDSLAGNPVVAAAGPLAPASVTFDQATTAYTLASTGGGLSGDTSLVKSGAGLLSLTGANTHGGGLVLQVGTLRLDDEAANTGAWGSGPITLEGGTLQQFDQAASFTSASYDLRVPLGASAVLRTDSRIDLGGALTGAGTLQVYVPWTRFKLLADWSAFTGRLNVVTDADGGLFRLANTAGLPAAHVDLAAATVLLSFLDQAGHQIPLGALSGAAGSTLAGIVPDDNIPGAHTVTWLVGARDTDATFAGTITDGTSPSRTAVTKIGSGAWTVTGALTHTGPTVVSAGTLALSGSLTNASTIEVLSGATLHLTGTLNVASLTIRAGGFLTGGGTINAPVLNEGTILGDGRVAWTFNGPVTNATSGVMRFTSGAALVSTAGFVNHGLLDLITAGSPAPAGLTGAGTVLSAASVATPVLALVEGGASISLPTHVGHGYQLQRSATLAADSWEDVGAPVSGTGGVIVFPAPVAPGEARVFFRVVVSP